MASLHIRLLTVILWFMEKNNLFFTSHGNGLDFPLMKVVENKI
ncbi:hypothetical protein GcC1_c16904o25 [Golovinomyces cichoracearum]|uniref:Uncharacterized protein n=1 Tax=Golovinomyces cichoracearum TaxID=62708 RepID=A0A420IVF7_9PEZI|nr:hypothetical protein GcC1_c16904o25 [Golovinomyces cichoracearum]